MAEIVPGRDVELVSKLHAGYHVFRSGMKLKLAGNRSVTSMIFETSPFKIRSG